MSTVDLTAEFARLTDEAVKLREERNTLRGEIKDLQSANAGLAQLTTENRVLKDARYDYERKRLKLAAEIRQLRAILHTIHADTRSADRLSYDGAKEKLGLIHNLTAAFVESWA